MGSTTAPPRRRIGLTLRMLMLLVVALACGLGWMANRIRVQRRAVAAIQKAGGSVVYDWEWVERTSTVNSRDPKARPPGPPWLRRWIGPELFESVREVDFRRTNPNVSHDLDDAVMEQIGQLRGVRRLFGVLGDSKVTGAMFAKIKDLKDLEILICGAAPSDAELAPVAAMTKLKSLTFNHTNLTNAGMEHLRGLTELKSLYLNVSPEAYGKIDSNGLLPLQGMTQMEQLRIHNARITTLAPLKSLTGLKHLMLDGNPIDDAGMEGLAHHPTLRNFELAGDSSLRLTDRTMKVLGTIPHLTQISASGDGISDQGLRDIGGLKDLTLLKLTNTAVKDFTPLNGLTRLKTLWISREHAEDGSLAFLDHMPGLKSLRLEGVRPSDQDLARLGRLAGLPELALVHAGITDEKLKHLSGMTGLNALTLGRDPITDAGLAHLSGLTAMYRLHLRQVRVTGSGLVALSRMPLISVGLAGCPADAAGVDALRSFPGLGTVNFSETKLTDAIVPALLRLPRCQQFILQNTNISPEGVAALKKARPEARIVTGAP